MENDYREIISQRSRTYQEKKTQIEILEIKNIKTQEIAVGFFKLILERKEEGKRERERERERERKKETSTMKENH